MADGFIIRSHAVLAAAGLALACLTGLILAAPAQGGTASPDTLRMLALQLVNASRKEHKLPPLALDPKLTQAAQSHASDMMRRNYYAHSSPEGTTVAGRYQQAGGSRWLLTAENIAKCDGCPPPPGEAEVRKLHDGWMKSPGHRANILRAGLDGFGFGLAVTDNGALYAVQTFAGPGTPGGDVTATAGPPASPADQAKAALDEVNAIRKSAGKPPLAVSAALSQAARQLLPVSGAGDFSLAKSPDLYAALPDGGQNAWAALSLVGGACGGCGVAAVKADAMFFSKQWLGQTRYAKILTDADMTHFGFAVAADGQGKKLALGLIGRMQ
jgi:uncharacterized protein YkwD